MVLTDQQVAKAPTTSKRIMHTKTKQQCMYCKRQYVKKHSCNTSKKFNAIKAAADVAIETYDDGIANIISESFFMTDNDDRAQSNEETPPESHSWMSSIKSFVNNNADKFLIFHLNINSFIIKFCEINILLNLCYFDILFFQESKLSDSFSSDLFKSNNYNIIRRDRTSNGGGIIIFVKKCYSISNKTIDSKFETISFSLSFKKSKTTFVSSYNPNISLSKEYLSHLTDFLPTLDLVNNVIFIGDLNHDLLSDKGTALIDIFSDYNFLNYVNKPTRISKTCSTLIDVLFSNKTNIFSTDVISCPHISDHEAIVSSIKLRPIKLGINTIDSRKLTEENLNSIRDEIFSAPFHLIDLFDNSDDKFFFFKKIITDIIDSNAPIKTIRLRNNHLPWFDQDIRDAIRHRDEQFVLIKRVVSDKSDPRWDHWRTIRNNCKSLMRKKMCAYFAEKTNEYKGDSKRYWSFHKLVVKMKKSKDASSISSIYDTDEVLQTDKSIIANTFNKFFSKLSCDLPEIELTKIDKNFNQYDLNIEKGSFKISKFSSDDVIHAVKLIDGNSSCGVTDIPVKVIKHCIDGISPVFAKLINHFVLNNSIPSELKCAIVTPLFKNKGSATSPDNYRGISVLSPFTKILERLLSSNILNHFNSNGLLCNEQHGFRSKHSCETALHSILDDWRAKLDNNKYVLSLFIDFKKAFDLVDQNILLRKLYHYGFDNNSIDLIKKLLSRQNANDSN